MAQTMPEKRIPEKLPIQYRSLAIERTADGQQSFSLSSEYAVPRWFGMEVLDHNPSAIMRERMEDGLPMLWNHDPDNLIGRWDNPEIAGGKVRATPRFGTSELAKQVQSDVDADIVRDTSMGYQVMEMKLDRTDENGMDWYRVTKWMPVEASLCSVPADPTVGVGRSAETDKEFPVVVTRNIPAAKAEKEPQMAEETATAAAVEVNHENPDPNYVRNVAVEIMACGKAYDIPDSEVQSCIRDGMNLENFKAYASGVLDQRIKKMKANQSSGVADVVVSNLTEREKEQFSIRRLILSMDPDSREEAGLEREVAKEISKRVGNPGHGGLWIPTRLNVRAGLDTKTDAAGKYSVFNEPQDLIELLRNRSLVIGKLGATVLSGLEGNPAFPVHATAPAITWVAENPGSDLTDADSTFGQKTMTPKMASMSTSYSRKFLAQSTLDAESFVRKDLADGHALGVDLAAINGAGSANQPLGLLKTNGIGDVAGGTNGAVPTYDLMVDLETAIATANADVAGIKLLTTPGIRGKLRKTQEFSSTNGKPVWTGDGSVQGAGSVLGYDAWVSNQVPSTLTKGNQSASHAIILGYWPDLLIGEWGALEIVVDPYAKKKQGMIEVTSYQMVDVLLRYPARFAAMQDALTA